MYFEVVSSAGARKIDGVIQFASRFRVFVCNPKLAKATVFEALRGSYAHVFTMFEIRARH